MQGDGQRLETGHDQDSRGDSLDLAAPVEFPRKQCREADGHKREAVEWEREAPVNLGT